jgi:hypothetical protein
MPRRRRIAKRKWLSPSNPDALSYVAYDSDEGYMNIKIADCYRAITLSLNDRKDRKKIDRLISFLQEAVEVYDAEA